MARMFIAAIALALLFTSAVSSQAALLAMEWADQPGAIQKTLQVGETATINIRLDLIAGETFGYAIDVPLGVGTWWYPDNSPNFAVTGYADDGELGAGRLYDRSDMPPAPFSPEQYELDMGILDPTVSGPATIYLDTIEIAGISAGHDDIVFGPTIPVGTWPHSYLLDENGDYLLYWGGLQLPPNPGYWTAGVGNPGEHKVTPLGTGRIPLPLELNVVPEPGTFALLCLGALAACVRRAGA